MRRAVWVGMALLVLGRLAVRAGERQRALDLCAELEGRQSAQKYTFFTGTVVAWEGGRFAVAGVRFEPRLPQAGDPGPIWVDERVARPGLGSGRRIAVFGPVRCRRPARNPGWGAAPGGSLSASGPKFRSWKTAERIGWAALVRAKFRAWISRTLARWPGLRALSMATWTGDAGALPESLRELYLEGGLLHILALSGQHVLVLAAILSLVGKTLVPLAARFGPKNFARYAAAGKLRLLISAIVLAAVSDGLAPLRRALAMVLFWEGLQRRRFHVGPLALLAGSAAAALVFDPALVESPSFLLSVVATAFVGRLAGYRRVSWVMPVLTGPLTALFFARVAWLAPLGNFLLGGIWGLLWLPMGFVAPFLAGVLPHSFGNNAERIWTAFLGLQDRAAQVGPLAYGAVIRPWVLEAIAWETLLVILLLPLLRKRALEWGPIP